MSASAVGRLRIWTISPGATHLRRVAATLKNSGRRLRRAMADTDNVLKQKGACALLPDGLREPGGRQRSPYGYGSRADVCERACSVDMYVSKG